MNRSSSMTISSQTDWLQSLQNAQSHAAELLRRPEAEQKQLGYFHTLGEICQQPWTWLETGERLISQREELRQSVAGIQSLVTTGSGSSEYAGECAYLSLRKELGIATDSISAGDLLIYGGKILPPGRPGVLVSLARSGNSPESCGAVEVLLQQEPQYRHVAFVCNAEGKLATTFHGNSKVRVVTLPPQTNDQSLVMTSSFTNLVLSGRFLGMLERPDAFQKLCKDLAQIVTKLLPSAFDPLAKLAATDFRRVVFLSSATRFGAARESSLKMLEMTAGRIPTLCETYLSFRHGPMTFAQADTLIVAYLSSDPLLRAYERDLLMELDRKELGLSKLIVGEDVPQSVVRKEDTVLECPGLSDLGDENASIVDVVVGQLLGFFRCREEGLKPDSPSEDGVIQRVVGEFPLHSRS